VVIDRAIFRFCKYYFRDKLFKRLEDQFRFKNHYIEKDINYESSTPYITEFVNNAFPDLLQKYITTPKKQNEFIDFVKYFLFVERQPSNGYLLNFKDCRYELIRDVCHLNCSLKAITFFLGYSIFAFIFAVFGIKKSGIRFIEDSMSF
jgi:hypothetical protein